MDHKPLVINGKEYVDFMVGADPEFRCRGTSLQGIVGKDGEFGLDGPSGNIAELRPNPKYCPVTLSFEIERILRDGYKKHKEIQKVDWVAGSIQDNYPVGGHIHFGCEYNHDSFPVILEGLDKFLAPVSLMLEDSDNAKKRRMGGHNYGLLALNKKGALDSAGRGYETKDYGGFEYRTLASWLTSKQFATALLCLGKVIAFEGYHYKRNKHLNMMLKFIPHDEAFIENFNSANKLYFIRHIPTIHRIVSSFRLFPRYEKYINYLFHMIAQGRTWDDQLDLKKRWKIIPTITKTEKKNASVSKKLNLDDIWNKGLVMSDSPFGSTNELVFLD